MRDAEIAKAVQLLDLMLEFFADALIDRPANHVLGRVGD